MEDYVSSEDLLTPNSFCNKEIQHMNGYVAIMHAVL